VVIGLIWFDLKTFGNIREKSYVELSQSLFLVATSVVFMFLASKKKASGLWLVAGFFVCLLIREQDAYFDDLFHGSWAYFALASVLIFTWKSLQEGTMNASLPITLHMKNT
jgi:hypothetical protein